MVKITSYISKRLFSLVKLSDKVLIRCESTGETGLLCKEYVPKNPGGFRGCNECNMPCTICEAIAYNDHTSEVIKCDTNFVCDIPEVSLSSDSSDRYWHYKMTKFNHIGLLIVSKLRNP